ncbi:transcriptional regulator GlxA family with amidase domain [Chitinophaga skermanii]|uniref:Transcriptional regulator GlxA family with amidase domain n=1 Tax=Chitinophaga skermanii TaxID=331697 RepID=A0A327QMR6_9BACT|nr:helix-turn-helix domain-containing protein [Chitinophaga skermanii]RAJ05165.1 transcriptional regulator GlxA family with amidase domain [Chitinophaga skermanii]
MKHISILVLNDAILGSIEGSHKVFTEVNNLLAQMKRPPAFQVELVGLSKKTALQDGLFAVYPEKVLDEVNKTDIILVPAIRGDLREGTAINQAFVPWIVEQYNMGAEVASLCVGAFLLASTGLLDGKKCATHWYAAELFKKTYPQIELADDKIIIDQDGIYSSGGAYSYLNLVLYIVEKYAGREVAVMCAKIFQIEIERDSQAPFMIFQGQKEHDDEPIIKAQEFIEQNYANRITVDQLAAQFAIGRRNFERRFKKATSNTVLEYIQRVKIEYAKKSLESSRDNVNEVMYNVGYNDTKAFRTVFKKTTGLSPIEYRNKYNREIQQVIG